MYVRQLSLFKNKPLIVFILYYYSLSILSPNTHNIKRQIFKFGGVENNAIYFHDS